MPPRRAPLEPAAIAAPSSASNRSTHAGIVADAARDAATEDSEADDDDGQDYDITVRMNDGRRRVIRQHELPNHIREGARVRVSGDRIVVAR